MSIINHRYIGAVALVCALALGLSAQEAPLANFMVLSDTHYYDPSLGVSGPAWEAYMSSDRKLLAESAETLGLVIDRAISQKPDFVLISGDLTKDGEKQCHQGVAAQLSRLAEAGIGSYVVPGNHDVNNPDARGFKGQGDDKLESVSPAEFAQIYGPYGYDKALDRDPASLSYIAQLKPGLWLLALDSCSYENNQKLGHPHTAGRLRPQTLAWAARVLDRAKAEGAMVIAMEHHPIMEHARDMRAKYGEYVLDNGDEAGALLSAHGVRLIFSGHFHASSIVARAYGGARLTDVETGSLVTWPCSYRRVSVWGDYGADFSVERVAQLPSYEAQGKSFDAEGYRVIAEGLGNIAQATMKKYQIPAGERKRLSGDIIRAMMAHYAGDASLAKGQEVLPRWGLTIPGAVVVAKYYAFIEGLWNIKPPKGVELLPDNCLRLKPDGSWEAKPLPDGYPGGGQE